MGAGNLLTGIVVETLRSVAEAGPFVLLAAGVLHEFLDTKRIVAAMGGRDLKSILTATSLGTPLPLCSCGVLPAALSLRKKGASREATIAFLISTPETGIDSIALTLWTSGPPRSSFRAELTLGDRTDLPGSVCIHLVTRALR